MNLPDYFLADLPAEASLTPDLITQACLTLKRNRHRFLLERTTSQLIETIRDAVDHWLHGTDPFLTRALSGSLSINGDALEAGLRNFFKKITADSLETVLLRELGSHGLIELTRPLVPPRDAVFPRLLRGPELLAHWVSDQLPVSAFTRLIYGILARSAQFIRCPPQSSLLVRLFAHSLYRVEPKLGACLEVAEWAENQGALNQSLLGGADAFVLAGSEKVLQDWRSRTPGGVRFVGLQQGVSFGFVSRDAVGDRPESDAVSDAGRDVIHWNQLGGQAPDVFYIQENDWLNARAFAELLAQRLASLESKCPRGPVDAETVRTIERRRSFYQTRARHDSDTQVWESQESTAWTVVYESDPQFQFSCRHRFIYVKPVKELQQATAAALEKSKVLCTVGLAAGLDRARLMAQELTRWGVQRICPLGQMLDPPLTSASDDGLRFADLVNYTDFEFPG